MMNPVARPASAPYSRFLVLLAILLALTHALLALTATTGKSLTADEIANLTAGHAYNLRGDYRLQPENGNFTQRWEALPLIFFGAPLPSPHLSSWQHADVWNYGHAFFYEQALPSEELFFLGRAMVAAISGALGLLIFFWSRELFGWCGAFLSLALYAFCPAFLAHGALATSDVVMCFFFLAAMRAWWVQLEKPAAGRTLLSATVFGLACVAKFSAVLLVPMFALSGAAWLLSVRREDGWRRPLSRLAGIGAVHAAAAWVIIWLFYGFKFSAFAPGLAGPAGFYRGDWDWILSGLGWQRAVIVFLRDAHALPEAFLYGFTFVVQFAQERGAFLNGEFSLTGWVGFFPYAFLVKTTFPMLGLMLLGLLCGVPRAWSQWRDRGPGAMLAPWRPLTPLVVLFAVYGATSLASHLNIGHRHILPLYPVLFIAAGYLGSCLDFRRIVPAIAVTGLLLWHVGESWAIRPDYLAYFNLIAGGPSQGYRHLVDSSLDWGQDLPGLKAWLDRNAGGQPVYLSYFGTSDPDYYGIHAQRLPAASPFKQPPAWFPLQRGVYCISATSLSQVYAPPNVRGPWTASLEEEYERFRALEPALTGYYHDPSQRAELDRAAGAEKWDWARTRLDLLRFARLCHYLRARHPDDQVGYSILIYRLTAAEIAGATGGSLEEWQALIDRSSGSHSP